MKNPVRIIYVMIIIVVGMVALASCTDEPRATRVLKSQGYTDIVITGYDFWGCSKDDITHTGFAAKGLDGNKVSGTVCAGWTKNSTVRISD